MSFYPQCGEQYFLSYIRAIFQGYDGPTMDLIYKEKIIAISLI